MTTPRCEWVGNKPIYVAYHDEEWGVPVHDDRHLFEMLVLDEAQAGLSWLTILQRRAGYRRAFDDFDPRLVAAYDDAKVEALLQDTGIIRNRQKINSAIKNAQACLAIQEEFGSLDVYLWQFVGGKTIQNAWETDSDIPTQTPESVAMSKNLRKRGFSFVGPTICYAFMQATGMVNDHLISCFRYADLRG